MILISGDHDESGYKSTMSGHDFVSVPFAETSERKKAIEKHVPCTGYPTPGVINTKTGAVIEADAWGKVDDTNFKSWMAAAAAPAAPAPAAEESAAPAPAAEETIFTQADASATAVTNAAAGVAAVSIE